MKRKLHFSTEQTLYLILNIIAHDVIHDYGPAGGSEKRWQDNQIYVKEFSNDYYTFRNPLTGGEEHSGKKLRTDEYGSSLTTIESSPNTQPDTSPSIVSIPGTNIHSFSYSNSNSAYSYPGQPQNLYPGRRILKLKRQDSSSGQPQNLYPGTTQPFGQSAPFNFTNSFPGTAQPFGQSAPNYANSSDPSTRLNIASGIYDPIEELTLNYYNYINVLNEMKNNINNTIIFTFFNHFLKFIEIGYFSQLIQRNQPIHINYIDTENYIVPLGYSNVYKDLFTDISNKFIGFCHLYRISNSLPYTDYLTILCHFLSLNFTIQSIFENIDSTDKKRKTTEGGYKSKKGGKKDTELSYEEATALLQEIDGLRQSSHINGYLATLESIYTDYNNKQGSITFENKNLYEDTRKLLVSEFQRVFNKYQQTKKAGSLYGDIDIVPVIKVRFSRHSVNLTQNFWDKINASIIDYYKIIDEYTKTQEKIEKRRLDDLLAAQQGDLTTADKEVRQQFSTFIARSGLFLTNICNDLGNINNTLSSLPSDSALRKEINILLYIADWTQNVGWQEIRNQSLDDELIRFFENTTPEMEGRYSCRGPYYIINNAAPITSDMKNLTFCPYTSILDGMSQCSWNSAQGAIEYGNMDFYITSNDESIYYNGKLNIDTSTIDTSTYTPTYPTNLNLSFNVQVNPNLILIGDKTTTISGTDLEAHFVLKNTLVNIINYIVEVKDTSLFTGGDIFNNLFYYFSRTDISLFNKVYSEILFKGTGDLFQEINSVCKFGGYKMDNYKIDSGILSMRTTHGDQLRFFAANDRPSGTRFIYMLLNGHPTEINMKAMGGYYSKERILVAKRPENKNTCQAISVVWGGKKYKYKNRTKKNKKNIPLRLKKSRNTKNTRK